MTELFDEKEESNGDSEPESVDEDRRDFEIRQTRESDAESNVELQVKIITPQKLEGSKYHDILTRDALLANFDSPFDIETGGMYHGITCFLMYMELNESAQFMDSQHTAWEDHTVGMKGFGRKLTSTTTIDKTQKIIRQQDESQQQGGLKP